MPQTRKESTMEEKLKPVQAFIPESLFIAFKKKLLDDGQTVAGFLKKEIEIYVNSSK